MRLLGWLVPSWLYFAAAALALGGSFYAGVTVRGWKCEAAKTKALEKQQREFDKALAEANTAAWDYETGRQVAREDARDRETKVRTIYRDIPAPSPDCAAPDAVRSVLADAVEAANGADPR